MKRRSYVSCYFEPAGDACENIVGFISRCEKRLDICAYYLTSNAITTAIAGAVKRKVKVRILADKTNSSSKGSDVILFAQADMPCKVNDKSVRYMHNKFMIGDKKAIITGSFNFTKNAERNAENIVIVRLLKVVKEYQKEFNRLWEIGEAFSG